MNIKIWSQSRQVARDRTRDFRVPSLNNGHHPDTMITATWHRVVTPWLLAFTIHTENLRLFPQAAAVDNCACLYVFSWGSSMEQSSYRRELFRHKHWVQKTVYIQKNTLSTLTFIS